MRDSLNRLGLGAATALFLCALARLPASAQFTPPYDPDFAPKEEAPRLSRPAQARAEEIEASTEAAVIPAGGPFLLIERPDPKVFFERPPQPAPDPVPFDDFLQTFKPLRYNEDRYNRARENAELGLTPSEGRLEEYTAPTEVAVSTFEPYRPPPPEVELPAYGTSLSITGRKVIGMEFSEKRFINEQKTTNRPATTSFFDINQQLQLRMQGKVGPKITVNVDYDDTKENKQDISVAYTGDPNEVVQNVSFGDIDLSLPATEFVSYNKQLFGIRGDFKYKNAKATVIGSRTKGVTKVRQFFGNTQFVAIDILDTSYLRRQYYDLTFGNPSRLPIKAGTERVFLAQQIPGQRNLNDIDLTVDDLAVRTSSFTGIFTPQSAGQDYTIDYVKGILTFRNALQPQFVVAVDFVDATGNSITVQSTTSLAGGSGLFKLVKTPSDLPIVVSSETGHNRELKTFYSIGQTQIVRDDGRGSFIFKVLDKNRTEVGANLNPEQKYTGAISGDTIFVDFENGIFNLTNPFSVANSSPTTPDPEIYPAASDNRNAISKRLFRVEYNFRFKTFFMEPNLVAQSEVVILDGVKLVRNVDYFIDYEAGFITFFNEDRIRADSRISIGYEVAPFFGISNESLLGTRFSYDINKHVSMGTTLLYQAGIKSPTVPTVTELAKSLLVYEFDTQVKSLKLFSWLTASMSAEFAQSRQNPNLNDFALVDNMEGIKQEDAASTLATAWRVSSNPGGKTTDPTKIGIFSEDVKILEINPRADASSGESQKVLGLQYDFSTAASTEASIVFPLSVTGEDFSQKTLLEVVMLGDDSNNELNFHLGGISEDSDSDGKLDTEDVNNDGILQASEDIGYLYDPAGKPSERYGAANGSIDSEDLNKNGRLDSTDFTGDDFGYVGSVALGHDKLFNSTDASTHTFVNFGPPKWRTFQIPLDITTATAKSWTAIKQVRVSVRKRTAGITGPSAIKFARIAAVGNTWQRGAAGDPSTGQGQTAAGEKLVVTPVNSVDNPDYVPIFNAGGQASEVFNDLYGNLNTLQRQSGSRNLSEQALQLEFVDLGTGAVVTTKRLFTRAVDMSQHGHFNFLINGNADGNNVNVSGNKIFFLRLGSDLNFFEVQVPLNFIGWKKIVITQADTNKDSVADTWRADTPGTVVVSSGGPLLQQVGQVQAGIRSLAAPAGQTRRGRVYLNEIYLSDPIARVGTAKKLQVDFEIPGWGTFGAKHRSVDRNFQTPTSVVSNQDNRQDSAYLNVSRLSFFPMTFNVARSVTETPSTVRTGDLSNLVTLLSQGKVTNWNGAASGNFTLGALPRMSLSHTRNRAEYELLTRLDDRRTYGGTLNYGVPLDWRILPKTVDGNFSYARHVVSFSNPQVRRLPGNANIDESATTAGGRLSFTPWEGSGFNPTYSLTRVREARAELIGDTERVLSYPKSLNQNTGFSSNFRVLKWFNPQMNYSVDTIENHILNVSTFIVRNSTFVFDVGQIKTVNRNSNGSVSLPLAAAEIFPATRLFRSFNVASGYQIQDGDVWNNVERGLRSQFSLWVRSSIRPKSPVAQRATQTLRDTYNSTQRWSPLEAYEIPGRWAAFRTLALSNNYVQTKTRTDVTGTISKTIAVTFPDAVASIGQLEMLTSTQRWISNAQMNFKYSAHRTEVIKTTLDEDEAFGTDLRTIIMKRLDTLVSYNFRVSEKKDLKIEQVTERASHEDSTVQMTFDVRKFRFTPKIEYNNDVKRLGTGVKTQDLTIITPSLLVRADLALPKGLRLPGAARTLLFTNRIIWTTTLSLANKISPVTIADNSRLFTFNTSGDYEIAKNLRMTLNGAASRLWHKFLKEEEFLSYQFGTTLTFQF